MGGHPSPRLDDTFANEIYANETRDLRWQFIWRNLPTVFLRMYIVFALFLNAMIWPAHHWQLYGRQCLLALPMAVLATFLAFAKGWAESESVSSKLDNSPQARFSRDEITQLEMEQEIERQLSAGLSGEEQMLLSKWRGADEPLSPTSSAYIHYPYYESWAKCHQHGITALNQLGNCSLCDDSVGRYQYNGTDWVMIYDDSEFYT